jgi:cytoskeletal protein RodZ
VIAPFRGQIIAAAAKDAKDQRKIMTLIGVVFVAVVLVVGLIVWGMFNH